MTRIGPGEGPHEVRFSRTEAPEVGPPLPVVVPGTGRSAVLEGLLEAAAVVPRLPRPARPFPSPAGRGRSGFQPDTRPTTPGRSRTRIAPA